MAQRRVVDYGSMADASDIKKIVEGLARSSVLIGNRFGVAGVNKIRILPGTAVTNQGVMIIEDEVLELNVPTTTNAQQYTVLYDHSDIDISGGVPAELRLANGALRPEDIDGVILGYINYPGGTIPLSSSMLIQEPELYLRNYVPSRKNAEWVIPIKGSGYMITAASGSPLTITDDWDNATSTYSLKLQNNVNSPSNSTAVFTFPFKVGTFDYALLQARMMIDTAVTVEFLFIDTNGNASNITAIPLPASTSLFLYELNIPTTAVQDPNRLCYVQMLVNVSYTRMIKLQGLGLSQYNLPL